MPSRPDSITFNNSEKVSAEESITTEQTLSSQNQGVFNKLSDAGKKIARNLLDRKKENADINLLEGRAKVCTNDFKMENFERDALKLKKEMERLDMEEIKPSQILIGAIRKQIEIFERKGYPGIDTLKLQEKVLQEKMALLTNKKNRAQTECKRLEDQARLSSKKRDVVADESMDNYKKEIMIMERQLEALRNCQNEIAAKKAELELKHQKRTEELREVAKDKANAETDLFIKGKTREEIKNIKALKELEKLISRGFEQMQEEKKKLNEEERKIEDQIAAVAAKLDKSRDRHDEFARYKKIQPISMDLPEKESAENAPIKIHRD